MPAYKCVQYAVWCDYCAEFIDYGELSCKNLRDAKKQWRDKGWVQSGDKWACPKCHKKDVQHA